MRTGGIGWRTRLIVVALIASVAALAGCEGSPVTVPTSEKPFLYLVLGERTRNQRLEFGQHAFLLTVGSATESAHYRTAEVFRMRRTSDGRRFGWVEWERTGAVGSFPAVKRKFNQNFFLPDTVPGRPLGASDLEPGGTYTLHIETHGVVIEGRTTIPANFTVTFVKRDGRIVAIWPTVSGAAGYRIEASPTGTVILQTDTTFVIPKEVVGPLETYGDGELEINALDPNLWKYSTREQMLRAGIDNGYGIFGALSKVEYHF